MLTPDVVGIVAQPVRRRPPHIRIDARGRGRRRRGRTYRCRLAVGAAAHDHHEFAMNRIIGRRVGKATTRVALFFIYAKKRGVAKFRLGGFGLKSRPVQLFFINEK